MPHCPLIVRSGVITSTPKMGASQFITNHTPPLTLSQLFNYFVHPHHLLFRRPHPLKTHTSTQLPKNTPLYTPLHTHLIFLFLLFSFPAVSNIFIRNNKYSPSLVTASYNREQRSLQLQLQLLFEHHQSNVDSSHPASVSLPILEKGRIMKPGRGVSLLKVNLTQTQPKASEYNTK